MKSNPIKQPLDLDFARKCKPYPLTWMWLLAAVFWLLLGIVVYQWQQVKTDLAAQSALAGVDIKARDATLAPGLKQSIQLAHQTQQALNVPWDDMLAALEKAQVATPDIRVLSIKPQPKSADIQITGVVQDFSVLAQYIASLKAQTEFSDAVLVSQRWEEASIGQVKMHFRLTVKWV